MYNTLTSLGFEHPLITLGVLGASILLYIFYRKKTKHGRYFKHSSLLREVYKGNTIYHYIFTTIIVLLIICYAVLLGKPYIKDYRETEKKEANDIIFVFDVSYSMIAKDVPPNRLEAAKDMFLELTESLGNNRLGLVLYAGKAFRSVPLSFDTGFMRQSIEAINVESLPQMRFAELQGTAIGDGLLMGLQSLGDESDEREKIIILMTDGEENRGVESRKVIPLLNRSETRVYTIAYGKDENAVIELQNQFGISERLAVGGIDEILLQEIAEKTGGKYYRASDAETIEDIVNSLSELNTGIIEIETYILRRYIFLEGIILIIFLQLLAGGLYMYKKFNY